MRITMLGTGTSHGVPTIDCMRQGYRNCPQQVCLKAVDNPRHRRTRSSILVVNDGHTLLIDTSQDFRTQMLATEVTHIDAVLYTHAHADHIHGIDDLRGYFLTQRRLIDIHADYIAADAYDSVMVTVDAIKAVPTTRKGFHDDVPRGFRSH